MKPPFSYKSYSALVRHVLTTAQTCGLKTLHEAYANMMHHYDCFFELDKLDEQSRHFCDEIERIGLATETDGRPQLCDLSIEAAIQKVDEYEIRGNDTRSEQGS